MSAFPTKFSTVTRSASQVIGAATPSVPSLALSERLGRLYAHAQRSHHIFGSPLGPFHHRGQHLHVPRFVYFGPHTHDESVRLAFLAGFDHAALDTSLALLGFIEHLALNTELGHGLNLAFFPLVDVVGLYRGGAGRNLDRANWAHSRAPEIKLLDKDARARGYHGFVRIETAPGEDLLTVRLRGASDEAVSPVGVELITSEDTDLLPVRWETDVTDGAPADGPLSLLDDLPFGAFELTLRVPSAWPAELTEVAVISVLKRFVLRYRGLQAYGQGI